MSKVILSSIAIGLFVLTFGTGVIMYANGYRFNFGGGGTGNIKFIEGTGILVATSKPDGARVIVNGHLTTATNNTINLSPGEYDVKIEKDGYLTWDKKITIKKSLVSEANALLLPNTPKLEAVTTIGISNLVIDPTQTLLAFTVASNSASKNGIYSLDMSAQSLIFLGDSGTQLVSDITDLFSTAKLSFSPNSKQILASLPNGTYYLLDSRAGGQSPQDVTNTLTLVTQDWQQQQIDRDKKLMASLPSKLIPIATKYFTNIIPSPDGNMLLYTASSSGTLKLVVNPPAPSVNSTPDHRQIKAGNSYVYDIKEDKNYEIGSSDTHYLWHADSRHLVYAQDGHVNVVEFDGGNLTTVYDGPFLDNLVFPWSNGSGIAILTRLSPSVPYNLYRLGLQ
ncbi:MAG TPA: PEGA domain-containing protein [Patescibacteria group bacterium]|nr:PEGA domain-containing protein [Patescibacteria group bacterium]